MIELHSRGKSGEFRNFLVHCNLQNKNKISLKNSNYWVFWKDVIWHDTVPKTVIKREKIEESFHLLIELHSRGQSGEFRNFLVHCNLQNKNKISLKNSYYYSFLKSMLFGMILFLNGNKNRKNPIKLPFVIEFHSREQSGEFRNFLVHCNLQK